MFVSWEKCFVVRVSSKFVGCWFFGFFVVLYKFSF